MKKIFENYIVLVLIQLIGMQLCVLIKIFNITPISDLIGRSPKWDVTFDLIWILLICAPAVYAYVQKIPHWKVPVMFAFLPFILIGLAILFVIVINANNSYQAQQQRKQLYDSPAKIEQVIGVPVPEFRVTNFEELKINNNYQKGYLCKSEITFTEDPTEQFYQALDSLCLQNSSLWQKNDNVYLMDSIQGRGNLSRIFFSLLHTKGEKKAYLEYHKTTRNLYINRRK